MVSIFEPDVADMIKKAFFVRPQPLFNRENIVGLNVHRVAYKQFKIISTFSCGLQRLRKSTIRLDEALDVAVFSLHTTTEDLRRCSFTRAPLCRRATPVTAKSGHYRSFIRTSVKLKTKGECRYSGDRFGDPLARLESS